MTRASGAVMIDTTAAIKQAFNSNAAKGIQKPAISVPHSVARRNFRSMAMQNNNLVSGLSLQPLKQAVVIREKIECNISRRCSCRDAAYSARER